jgi:two-component system sensor histidine kinase UhpB
VERRKSGDASSYELAWTRKNGEKIVTVVSPNPIFDEKGDFKGSFAVFTDITERKRVEEELRGAHEQLRALSVRLSQAGESERKRIARELHDQVGQNLTALGINLNMLRVRLADVLTDETDSRLNDSLNLLEETVTKIRDVMADLRPSVLDDYGLMAAIRWYCEQFSNRTGVEVVVEGREFTPRLASEVEITLFRIVQELLTNIAKHAMASLVTVSLVETGKRLSLTIGDNGLGFDPVVSVRSEEEKGWGLLNIRERVESIGGKVTVESKPGQGTRVEIVIRR